MAKRKHSKPKSRKSPTESKCYEWDAMLAKSLSDEYQRGFHKWLSQSGRVVEVSPCASVPDIGDGLRKYIKGGKLKDCYGNALRVAKDLGVFVVIGQAFTRGTVDHAWNATETGVHFDVTAELLKSKGRGTGFVEYYAVLSMTADEFERLIEIGTSDSVLASIYEKQCGPQAGEE
jgi:hypothetical protein